jgi:hypothetical protein
MSSIAHLCLPLFPVYSLFAALEYFVVVSNIIYHGTLQFDFAEGFALQIGHEGAAKHN